MPKHSHNFVETYKGLVGFGLDRTTNEKTIIYYLQKFSDDKFMEKLITRLTDEELGDIFCMVNKLMKKHLAEPEYHHLFLKDNHP